jgi:hypothetical protein
MTVMAIVSFGGGGLKKIFGKAQRSTKRTPLHAETSLEAAAELLEQSDIVEAHLNRQWRSATEEFGKHDKRRPDVVTRSADGRFTGVEVMSGSDNLLETIKRNLKAMRELGERSEGTFFIWPTKPK